MGLGLSIVSRLIDKLGGALCLESDAHGTTVYCSLPVAVPPGQAPGGAAPRPEPPASPRETGAALPPAAEGNIRALLVEDDAINRLAARQYLEKQGVAVLTAASGREALELLARDRVDVVLMDIHLPEIDGVAATRIMRTAPEYAHVAQIPVVAMTAYAMAGDKEKFLAAGMDAYIEKPLDLARLARLAQQLAATGRQPS